MKYVPAWPRCGPREMAESVAVLGIAQHHFLGYRDSGMMGSDPNEHPDCFWQADFTEATGRLIHLIRRHRPEVMTIYDPFGGYGHPDHIQVPRVGMAAYFAAEDTRRFPLEEGDEVWSPSKLYMSTWPRSRVQVMTLARLEAGLITEEEAKESEGWGTPDEDITTLVDVRPWIDRKVAALRAHRDPDSRGLVHAPGSGEGRAERAGHRGLPAAPLQGGGSLPGDRPLRGSSLGRGLMAGG